MVENPLNILVVPCILECSICVLNRVSSLSRFKLLFELVIY
jgi:hypothetical protein